MKRLTKILFIAGNIFLCESYSQGNLTPYVSVNPKISYQGDTQAVEVKIMLDGCKAYQFSRSIDSNPIDTTHEFILKLRIDTIPVGICTPVFYMGYFRDTLFGLSVGRYLIKFDTASDLSFNLLDTARFEIISIPNNILRHRNILNIKNKEEYDILGRRKNFINLRIRIKAINKNAA